MMPYHKDIIINNKYTVNRNNKNYCLFQQNLKKYNTNNKINDKKMSMDFRFPNKTKNKLQN